MRKVDEEITQLIKNGDRLAIPGFGTWGVKERATRMGCNPQTGATIKIPARRVAYFKARSLLKAAAKGRSSSTKKGKK